MKFSESNNLRSLLGGAAASVLLLSGLAAYGQAFSSPVGDWDIVETGARSGVAQIHFNSDGTMLMSQVLVPRIRTLGNGHTVEASRGLGGDDSRGLPLPDPNALPLHTNLYGGFGTPSGDLNNTNADGSAYWLHVGEPAGRWGFDISGKLIGFFSEIGAPSLITTNLIPIGTNTSTGTNITLFLTNVDYLRITNAISFNGKVSYNMSDLTKSRLTLVCSTPAGKVTFSGLPPIQLTDLSTGGSWYGTKRQNGLPYNEFFALSNPNTDFTQYDVDGEGPDYIYSGAAIVVRQKKIGIAAAIVRPHAPPDPANSVIPIIRALIGPVNLTKPSFTGNGYEGSDDRPDTISYKGVLTPFAPAP